MMGSFGVNNTQTVFSLKKKHTDLRYKCGRSSKGKYSVFSTVTKFFAGMLKLPQVQDKAFSYIQINVERVDVCYDIQENYLGWCLTTCFSSCYLKYTQLKITLFHYR